MPCVRLGPQPGRWWGSSCLPRVRGEGDKSPAETGTYLMDRHQIRAGSRPCGPGAGPGTECGLLRGTPRSRRAEGTGWRPTRPAARLWPSRACPRTGLAGGRPPGARACGRPRPSGPRVVHLLQCGLWAAAATGNQPSSSLDRQQSRSFPGSPLISSSLATHSLSRKNETKQPAARQTKNDKGQLFALGTQSGKALREAIWSTHRPQLSTFPHN